MFDFIALNNLNIDIKNKKLGYYLSIKDNAIYRDDFPIDKRLDLKNHSPLCLTWGYNGSGCRQSALAILTNFTKDDTFGLKYYEDFNNDVISKLPEKDLILKYVEVQNWIDLIKLENIE